MNARDFLVMIAERGAYVVRDEDGAILLRDPYGTVPRAKALFARFGRKAVEDALDQMAAEWAWVDEHITSKSPWRNQ